MTSHTMRRQRHDSRRRAIVQTAAPSETRLLVAFLAAVFALKLAVMLQLKDHVLTQPDAGLDTTAYVSLARRVLGGDVALGPGQYFVSPLYIYFLAGVLWVKDSFTAVRLLQIVLGTGAVALIHVAASEWFGRRAAWMSACLAALTGLFTFYESLLLQASLDPFLTAASLACLALGLKRGQSRWYLLAGLVFGVQVCNRPNIAIPAVAVAMLLVASRRWRPAAVLVAGMAIALTPVTLRNIVVSGYWSPVTASHGGLNFYVGNNPGADGTYRPVPEITPDMMGQQGDTRRVAERATGRALDDPGVSWYFYTLSWKWMREQPLAAAKLFGRKLSLMFSAGYIWLNYSYPFFAYDARTSLRALVIGPWLLIPLGVVGLVTAAPKSNRLEYAIWTSFVPVYAVAVAVFYVTDRYQLPILIPLCVGAGAALDALFVAVIAQRWTRLAIAIPAFVAVFIWVNRPLRLDDGIGEERTRMAERLITLGRYEEAEQWAIRAEQAYPRPGVVHFRLGQRLLVRDQPEAAIAHFQKALTFDPSQPLVEYALGETFLEAERPQEAIAHLRLALEAGVNADQAAYDLVRALGATGDRAGAIRVLQNAHPAREGDAERWVALGEIGIQLQEPTLAEKFFRRAIAARPDFALAHGQLGLVLGFTGRPAEAARELEDAVRLNPLDAIAWLNLAVADVRIGRLSDARLHAQRALQLNPADERAKQLLQTLKR